MTHDAFMHFEYQNEQQRCDADEEGVHGATVSPAPGSVPGTSFSHFGQTNQTWLCRWLGRWGSGVLGGCGDLGGAPESGFLRGRRQ